MQSSVTGDPDFSDETLDHLIRSGKIREARAYLQDMEKMAKEMGDRKGMANYKQYEVKIKKASASQGFKKTSDPYDPY